MIAAAVLVVAGLLAGCGAPGARLAAATGSSGSRDAAMTTAIRGVMRQWSVPGTIVGVWQQGQAPYVRAFGVRNKATRQPMTTGLYLRIGSETKTFTVTALLQLAEDGKVGLGDPIARYVSGVPHGKSITLRELANMRSGLFGYVDDRGFQRAFDRNPERQWTPRQLLNYSFRHPLLFQPGTAFAYSDTNTILLGLVIEKVSGQSLRSYITQHILKPEHLTRTLFPAGPEFPSPHAQGYTNQTSTGAVANATNWNPAEAWAAGAMISNLANLHAWARIVATGELLTRAMQRQREQFLPTGMARVSGGYGLGLFKVSGWIGHNGSIPGYQSLTLYLPSARATLVVLVNTDIGPAYADLTSLIGRAITKIITPGHVYYLPNPTP